MAQHAGGNILNSYPMTVSNNWGPEQAFQMLHRVKDFERHLRSDIRQHGPIKAYINVEIKFQQVRRLRNREILVDNSQPFSLFINAPKTLFPSAGSVRSLLAQMHQKLLSEIDNVTTQGSSLRIQQVVSARIVTTRYQPGGGGSFIPLPAWVQSRQATINIQNKDQFCLLYCLLLHRHTAEIGSHPERTSKYKRYTSELLHLGAGLYFPFDADSYDFGVLESRYGAPINVYILDEQGGLLPRRISTHPAMQTLQGQQSSCNVLLLQEGDRLHYVYITKLPVLCAKVVGKFGEKRRQPEDGGASLQDIIKPTAKRIKRALTLPAVVEISNEDEDESSDGGDVANFAVYRKQHHCLKCLCRFATVEKLERHIESKCGEELDRAMKEIYPELTDDGVPPTIHYDESKRQAIKSSIRVYADFESLMVNAAGYDAYLGDEEGSFTKLVSVHKPCSAAFVVSAPGTTLDQHTWLARASHDDQTGDGIAILLLKALHALYVRAKKEIPELFYLPVFFHNLSGYDGHFLTLAMGRLGEAPFNTFRKDVIAKNSETFAAITYGRLRFLDSLALLGPGMGLDNAVKTLTNNGTDFSKFHMVRAQFPYVEDQQILFKKGQYPYDYFTTVAKFEEQVLPPKEAFKSKLDCNVSEETLQTRWTEASTAWHVFGCRTLADYHDVYLRLDVALLADVFEAFRSLCLKDYDLDPGNGVFLSLPNFSWFAMLKSTLVSLEQITDPDMYQMIERGKRGGQAVISHRFATANNRYLPEGYDPAKGEENYIMYLDANNLYGLAMSMKLPQKNFRWATKQQLESMCHEVDADGTLEIDSSWVDGDTGVILEVDLEYPLECHDLHADYPLTPEALNVTEDMLSPLQAEWLAQLQSAPAKTDKLCGTLRSKTRYVVHGELLRFYLEHGIRLKRVHRAIMFTQSAWLEPYIRFNTEKRAVATSEAEKSFYKLLNNAVFGKTMENVRHRTHLTLVSERTQLLRLVSRPNYKLAHIFQPDDVNGDFLVGVEMHGLSVKLDKPIYAGVSILDLSKLHMYRFHYDTVKPKWGARAKLLFTDTDSLVYQITTPDYYREVAMDSGIASQMDFSDTDLVSPFGFVSKWSPEEQEAFKRMYKQNKKVLGKFKDEMEGVPIKEFVGLRAKCYSVLTAEDENMSKAKGVNRHALKAFITHEHYKQTLLGDVRKTVSAEFHCFQSRAHQIMTVHMRKQALSKYDDKRYILDDGISTRPYGHYLN